jgi:hypothetical protein
MFVFLAPAAGLNENSGTPSFRAAFPDFDGRRNAAN